LTMNLRLAWPWIVLLCASPASAAEQELESSERGDWIADVTPNGKYASATDCPCEIPLGITFYCTVGSGLVLAKFEQFDWEKGKAGAAPVIGLDIDGAAQTREAKLIEQFPGFEARHDDPLFDQFAKGKRLKSAFDGKTIESTLRGSKKAMAVLRKHCAPKGD
jgi:hypothetical protein